MTNTENTIESLIAEGFIGADLGALLSEDKEDGAVIGALLSAAFSSTLKASEDARKTNLTLYLEEDGKLYERSPDGDQRLIRRIEKPEIKWPEKLKLK